MDIRAAIRAEQGWCDWSDKELCTRAGISQSTFSRRMAGKEFSLAELQRIADAFGIGLSDLIELAERKTQGVSA